jgi:SAM-dependent methyltransferase
MLEQARSDGARSLIRGNVIRLPLADRSFDAVVCCRLLHHLAAPRDVRAVVRELVRVSRGLVIASFWDAGSLPAFTQRHLPSLGRRAPRRHVCARGELVLAFEAAGAEVIDFAKSVPLLTRQSFVVARRPMRAP